MSKPMRDRREQKMDRQQSYDEYQAHVSKEARKAFRAKAYQIPRMKSLEYLKMLKR